MVGVVIAIFVGGATGVPNGMFAFAVWIGLGLFFGGIVWIIDTLSLWRSSLTRGSSAGKDPAVQALRERYARGELDENQFEAMLRHLREV
jgi:putative membrane protein